MRTLCISIAKEAGSINEDAVIAKPSCIAVADGAGGGGVFAERWSQYLLNNLPETPITTFEQLDQWVDRIWEPYYNECEELAKSLGGGMLLTKFYEEGSFSTLAAVWQSDKIHWATYGDSVVFCYNWKTKELQYSIRHLSDFSNAPYLVSCKDPMDEKGFSSGTFESFEDIIYFVTSDALAHYILMMYMVSHFERFNDELSTVLNSHSRNSQYVKSALSIVHPDFDAVLSKLFSCIGHRLNFTRHLEKLRRQNLLAVDDYSIGVMSGCLQISFKG